MPPVLSPAQQAACDELLAALPIGHVFVLEGHAGTGKTTVLRELQRRQGAGWRTTESLVDLLGPRHPLALEEAFGEWLMQTLAEHPVVVLDDLSLLLGMVSGYCGAYPRTGLINIVLKKIASHVAASGKKLVIGCERGNPPDVLHHLAVRAVLGDFTPADYEHLCRAHLDGPAADRLDYAKIHRFAPRLNAHQLEGACVWLRREDGLDTERFLAFLRSRELTSNVDLDEVQPVSLRDLRGVDDVVEALEAHVVLPLENDELTSELRLRPKRGVLLVGPPGTGKTTVGRALAHRLESKFFLIDGTVISGTDRFYGAIHHIFEQAKYNAPAVIFIDDSDVIFESGEELGPYRYLLTMLDGLESASAGRVCLVLTAMDVSSLPPALLRSGRVELWLEMRLPDAAARADILRQHLEPLLAALAELSLEALVEATDSCTGADLKRLIEDGKNLLAYDRAQGRPLRPVADYFLGAIETLRTNKLRYAEAEAHARRQRPERPVYYDVGDGRA